MKPIRFKDNIRNIRKMLVSWLSIIVIACLAVTAFLGIRFSAEALRGNVNRFYEEANYRDAEILGTLYLTEENLEEIAHLDGVQSVTGIRRFDTQICRENAAGASQPSAADGESGTTSGAENAAPSARMDVTVLSHTDIINRSILLEGRQPAGKTECLIEKDIADTLHLCPGDMIEIPATEYLISPDQSAASPLPFPAGTADASQSEETDTPADPLIFTVVGIVTHPDHPVLTSEVPGSRYVLIDPANFNAAAYDNCYSGAEVIFSKEPGTNRFSKDYFENTASLLTRLEDIGVTRAAERFENIRDRYQAAIDEGQAELDDAKAQLQEARAELDLNHGKIKNSEKELADALKTLQETKAQLDDAGQQLTDAKKQLDSGKSQLDAASSRLRSARNELAAGYEEALHYRAQMQNAVDEGISEHAPEQAGSIRWATGRSYDVDSSSLSMKHFPITKSDSVDLTSDIKGQLLRKLALDPDAEAAARSRLDAVDISSIEKKASRWESAHNDYLSGRRSYESARAEYERKLAEYQSGMAAYEEGKAQYEDGLAAYHQGVDDLNAAKEEIAERENEYDAAVTEYENGLEALEGLRNQMANIPDSRWIVMGVKGNSSYVYTKALAGNFSNISATFSLLFVFVGALVIYATVGKIVDEQRKQIGTTKALGFFNREVMAKYLTFGLTATLIGTAAGIALSYFVVEKAILGMQIAYYHIGEAGLLFEEIPAAVTVALAIALTLAAVLLAGGRLVRTPAIRLMQDAVPAVKRKKKRKRECAKEGAEIRKGSLYRRLILRNMRTDLRRVIVTIVSVAGSCALMVIGLTISHSMSSAVDIQFNEIYRYDYLLDYDISRNGNAEKEIREVLDRSGAEYIRISSVERPFLNGDELDSTSLLCGDPEELADYITFAAYKTGEPVALDGDGIYVPQKLEEGGGFAEKGRITVYDGTMKPYLVDTSGVFMSYIARFLVISEKGYRLAFAENPVYNEFLIRKGGAAFEELKEQLENIEGVRSFIRSEDRKANFESYIGIAGGIVILLTAMAFVMAYFILLNLVNMLVNQKKKELTVMRINGFSVREVKAYIGREMILTTFLGILLGIAAGAAVAFRIILLLENINCFDRRLYYPGWGIAACVTALLSLMISLFALRKVKKLSLTDVG